MSLRQPSMTSVMLYYQCLTEPSNNFFSTVQEGNLLVPKADECSSKDETIKLFRKISAEHVSDQFI